MKTAMQWATLRRRTEARKRAVIDRNYWQIGYLDRKLNVLEHQCPFAEGSPQREQWLAGFRAVDQAVQA